MCHGKEKKKRPYADRSHRLEMSASSSGGGVAYVVAVYMSRRSPQSDAIGRRPKVVVAGRERTAVMTMSTHDTAEPGVPHRRRPHPPAKNPASPRSISLDPSGSLSATKPDFPNTCPPPPNYLGRPSGRADLRARKQRHTTPDPDVLSTPSAMDSIHLPEVGVTSATGALLADGTRGLLSLARVGAKPAHG